MLNCLKSWCFDWSSFATALLPILFTFGLQGCATKPDNHNQTIFEQALVLQQVSPASTRAAQHTIPTEYTPQNPAYRDEIIWSFPAGETTLTKAQVTELFHWLAIASREKASDYQGFVLLLRQGPDWLTSHNRGKTIRNRIPRALTIRQEYRPDMEPNQVSIKMVNVEEAGSTPVMSEKHQQSATQRQNTEPNRNNAITREQIMALIRQGGRNEQ